MLATGSVTPGRIPAAVTSRTAGFLWKPKQMELFSLTGALGHKTAVSRDVQVRVLLASLQKPEHLSKGGPNAPVWL